METWKENDKNKHNIKTILEGQNTNQTKPMLGVICYCNHITFFINVKWCGYGRHFYVLLHKRIKAQS